MSELPMRYEKEIRLIISKCQELKQEYFNLSTSNMEESNVIYWNTNEKSTISSDITMNVCAEMWNRDLIEIVKTNQRFICHLTDKALKL